MKTTINFLLNGVPVEIDFNSSRNLYPHMTVLQYLREHQRLTGTKEGCGVGDCGACTVCLIERDANHKIIASAVNGCLIMLAMLDNKHLVTIEGISGQGRLHPVQKSLIDKRGSQCGFCSPGMIMSAFVHYINDRPFTRREIENFLSGNLCRCTGYESIIEAFLNVGNYARENFLFDFPQNCNRELFVENDGDVYIKPLDLNSLLKYKEAYPGYALISGASDMSLKIRDSLASDPAYNVRLIDISDIEELKNITIGTEYIEMGGNVSIEQARKTLMQYYPQTSGYMSAFASGQIRSKATLAGSVAGASPVGDIMPLLLSLGAKIKLCGINHFRIVDCREFNLSYRKHIMREDEIIDSFLIPLPSEDFKLFCHKQSKRRDVDIATLTFCISFVIKNGVMKNVCTGYGGMATVPKPSLRLESFLEGKAFSEETFNGEALKKAKEVLREEFSPISDVRGSAEYRMTVAENLLVKLYKTLNQQK